MMKQQLFEKVKSMSVEEKALELTQYPSYLSNTVITGGDTAGELSLSQIKRTGTLLNTSGGEDALALRRDRQESGIVEPTVIMHDVIHGYRTIAPVPLALAASFNLQIIEDCAEIAAVEAKYDGIDVTFSPMVDLVRDARWGRVMESAGEDAFLGGEVGKAYIRGYHRGGLACCVKHFAAYGAAEGGKEYNTTEVSEQALRNYYLRGYAACMQEKPELVMSSFNLLNGVPVTGSPNLTVGILRNEWGFDGVLISDYAAVKEMTVHGYCADEKAAALAAIKAKVDIEMCSPCYARSLPALLEEGKVSLEELDEAVMRVLELKTNSGCSKSPTAKRI